MINKSKLDFVRQPQPRNCEDYIAVRRFGAREVKYGIWNSTDSGFGLSIQGLPPTVQAHWEGIYRGHCGLRWLRTKRRCEEVANTIADMVEREQRDSVKNRLGG